MISNNTPSDWHPVQAPTPVSAPPPSGATATPPPTRPAHRGARGATLATLLAVAIFGGLVGFAADHWLSTTGVHPTLPVAASAPASGQQASTAPAAAPTAVPAQPTATVGVTDPTQQAIQQVIQKGDQEQAQALASKDPTLMQDTSTDTFYQQQVRTNQDLLDNGVTAIKLLNIDWGQISVNGSTATATAWETWSTTYSDGTTDQARDRNVYTLVQDNGTWKVQSDEHPDEAVGPGGAPGTANPAPAPSSGNPGTGNPATGSGTPGTGTGNPGTGPGTGTGNPSPGRRTQPGNPGPGAQDVSQNWAGYAASGGSFTSVTGTWTVPQFTPDSPAGADATWVGIGGLTSHDLIQAGTQQSVSGSGQTQYQSWVETLPQASHPLPVTIHPGDSVTVTISQQQAPDQWLVDFKNDTTGQSYQVNEQYTSTLSSAEWIEEAPSGMRGGQAPLDNFGTVTFTQATAVKDGQTVNVAQAGGQAITMAARGQTLAQPSSLSGDGAGFSVTRSAASATSGATGQPGQSGQGQTPRYRRVPGLGSGSGTGSSGFGTGPGTGSGGAGSTAPSTP